GARRLWRTALEDTVGGVLTPDSVLYRRMCQPLAVAAMKTGQTDASDRLLWRVLAETIGRGAAACRPMLARDGLSESLVYPALSLLSRRGAEIRFGSRLRAFGLADGRVCELLFEQDTLVLPPEDSVILA